MWDPQSDKYFFQRKLFAFDLDDTLTTHGSLLSATVQALEELLLLGKKVVIVTGRSVGWADALVKLLPVDAIVAENGAAIWYWKHGRLKRKPRDEPIKVFFRQIKDSNFKFFSEPDSKIQVNLVPGSWATNVIAEVKKKIPRARVASDQKFRMFDLAIDFAEEVNPPLSLDKAVEIQEIFKKFGAGAKVSSIHVNGWVGKFSKAKGLEYLANRLWKLDLKKNSVYVGDSPNDSPLFKEAGISIGVVNIQEFIGKVSFDLPLFITRRPSGSGVCEILRHIKKFL